MNDTMALLLATVILTAGGLGFYVYKSSDDYQNGGDNEIEYDEDNFFNLNDKEEIIEDDNEYDTYLEECRLKELNRSVEEWNKLIAKEIHEKDMLNDKHKSIARKVYKNNIIDLSNINISDNGVKFIIQKQETSYK